MKRPVLTIFYQFDPWSNSLGGIQTTICSYLKYAPDTFDLRLVGIQCEPRQTLGTWQWMDLEGRALQFMPLLTLPNDNYRSRIPITIRYAAALAGQSLASDFMHFHRLEPTLMTRHWPGDKTLFIHNDIERQMQGGSKAILWNRLPSAYFALEKLAISQFREVLSCNTASERFYRNRYPQIADRIRYLRNSFDEKVFYPLEPHYKNSERQALAERMQLSSTTRFVMFAGRLHAQKDPLLLIRAFAALNDPDCHLLIAGEGDLAESMRQEILHLGLSSQVTMLGAISQQRLAQLLRLCSACILTSAYEGLPLIVLEALGSGTPVVTTRCGETPNLLTSRSGVVSQDRSVLEIAAALRQVLEQPQCFTCEECLRAAEPFAARSVINSVYSDMVSRWQVHQTLPIKQRLSS
jgi:glycosyltransferase involved in cell wall biosynthesis